ncbi:MAG: hypothetical protein ACRDY2_13550, partial [Acidimicrobiales bacterium]
MAQVIVCLDRDVLAEGQTLSVAETRKLTFAVFGAPAGATLAVGGDRVPLVPVGDRPHLPLPGPAPPGPAPPGSAPAVLVADPVWVEHAATEHLVGDCLVSLHGPGGAPLWHATLRRQPSRITSDQHRWLLDELRRR